MEAQRLYSDPHTNWTDGMWDTGDLSSQTSELCVHAPLYTIIMHLIQLCYCWPRLIPVLLNGMKYSELDIIILKVRVTRCMYMCVVGVCTCFGARCIECVTSKCVYTQYY